MNALSRLPADALQRSEEGAKRKLIYSFYSFVCPLDLIHWLRLALGAEIARSLNGLVCDCVRFAQTSRLAQL